MRIAHHITQHLIPTKHNGFVPHLLRERQVIGMLVIGLVVFSFAQYTRISNYFGQLAEVYPATIISLTNKDRATNSLPALSTSKTLEAAAKLKAQDMATKGYFAHTSPEGKTPWYWFAQAGYTFIYAGENLAVNFSESDRVETAWLNSPTHRANIMNKNFTEMGVATATGTYNGKKTTFVVELFGMPAVTSTKPVTIPVQPTAPKTTPAPVKTPTAPTKTIKAVAGASSSHLSILEETPTFSMAQNTDPTLEPGNTVTTPDPKIPWYSQFIVHSDRIAGLILEIILILAIITTAGMVAREYEKHHRKHMAYGALITVIMFTALFVGGFGFFTPHQPVAAAPELQTSNLQ